MSVDDVKKLLAVPRLQIGESVSVPEGFPSQSMFEIETGGLEAAWSQLSVICAAGPGTVTRPVAFPAPIAIPYLATPPEPVGAPGAGWGVSAPK